MPAEKPDIQAIFNEAVALISAEDRVKYLDQACGDDRQARARIEALLSAHSEAGGFFGGKSPAGVATEIRTPTEASGAVIGPYKLIEQIGEGGMGTVWMAQQTEPVKRLVAVKLIKAGMDSAQVIARFEAERQALALMDHTNIARVLDAGTTAAGRPYFIMDLVKGMPITQYCDEHHLTLRQRLELFIPVCQAVQHAHQKGIIHRDLKPSNVLVALYDGKPLPKVIDFGVAKATGQSLTDKTLVTGFGNIVGTLEYMSPEQAEVNRLDIDTRSDIYSLGVLLYELLAGSTPFSRKDLQQAGMLEMLRVIREQEPSRPSTKLSSSAALPTLSANRGTEPARLTKLVRGELDWIVMKALDKDRNRRYETANGFAEDLQRYLADEPVQACPPSTGYRLRKFALRNKGSLAMASLVLFFLVLLGSGIGWAVRDRSAREAEFAQERVNREAELTLEREARKSKAAGQVETILSEVNRLENEQKWREALAAARRAGAAVAGGEVDAATAELVRERLKDLEFNDRLEQIRMEAATFVAEQFNKSGANREYGRAFREYGVDVEELPVHVAVERLQARPNLALPLAAALDHWVDIRQGLEGQEAAVCKRLVAVARGIDPDLLRDQIRAARGQPVTPPLQAELRRMAESVDIKAQHPATIISLARTLRRAGESDSALQLLKDAQQNYLGDFWLIQELASAFYGKEDFEDALRFYTAAASIRPNSALSHSDLGAALRQHGKPNEAIAYFRKAIELDPKYVTAYYNLGCALTDQGKFDEASACHRKALQLNPTNWSAYNGLGVALVKQKRFDEAVAAYHRAIELVPKELKWHGRLQHNVAVARGGQGLYLATTSDAARRDPVGALEAAKEALNIKRFAPSLNSLGAAQYRLGDWKSAADALVDADSFENSGDPYARSEPEERCAAQLICAMACSRLGDKAGAQKWFDMANAWLEKNNPTNADLGALRAEAVTLMEAANSLDREMGSK